MSLTEEASSPDFIEWLKHFYGYLPNGRLIAESETPSRVWRLEVPSELPNVAKFTGASRLRLESEHYVLAQLEGTRRFKVQPRLVSFDDGMSGALSFYQSGETLDSMFPEAMGLDRKALFSSYAKMTRAIGGVPVSGFGHVRYVNKGQEPAAGLAGEYDTLSEFLEAYAVSQIDRSPAVAPLHETFLSSLHSLHPYLDREVRAPTLVCGDLNNRNLVFSEGGLRAVHLQALWGGDPLSYRAQQLIHWPSDWSDSVIESVEPSDHPRLWLLAMLHCYLIAAFADRVGIDWRAISPWGVDRPVVERFWQFAARLRAELKM